MKIKANHSEAYELACMKSDESNLARAYMELSYLAAKYFDAAANLTSADDRIIKLHKARTNLEKVLKEIIE